jgi:transposase
MIGRVKLSTILILKLKYQNKQLYTRLRLSLISTQATARATTKVKAKKLTKTMLKLELKGEPNSLKFLDNLFSKYGQLVRIADSFVYHLYPYYANINEQEELERLKELIKSLDEKAIRKNKRRKREPYEEEEQATAETENKYQYTHSKLLKTLLHRFIKYAKKYYGIDAKYAYLEMQGGLADLMHSNAENAYKHRTIPNLRGLSNVMPIRVSKRPLVENRRSKDNDEYYKRTAEFIFNNGKIMFRIGSKHKGLTFKIAERFNDVERLGMLIDAIQGKNDLTIGDPCYLVRKETDNRYRYYIMVSISKNVDVKALYESIKNKSKIRIVGIDSNISKYIATMFCIEVDKENKEFKLINAKGINSKDYINAVKKYEEERRKLQQGRMKGKKQKKKGSRYKGKEDYIIRNRCGDSKREDLRRQLIGYICNLILEFANENDADIIVIEDLKGLNKELKTLKIIKKELGKLYNDVNDKGNNAIDDKINEINKKYKNKIRRPLLELLNKIKEYSNNRDRIKVAKYILKQRQIIERRIFLLSIMAYYQFKQELEVEALWNGKLLYTINPKYTSQQCLRCGHTNKLNRITQRQFKCIRCNFEMNADFNASANIALRFASEILKLELELKQGESSSMMTATNATTPLHASINAGSKLGVVAATVSSVASILQDCDEGRSPCLGGQTEQSCSAKRLVTLGEFLEKKGNGG